MWGVSKKKLFVAHFLTHLVNAKIKKYNSIKRFYSENKYIGKKKIYLKY